MWTQTPTGAAPAACADDFTLRYPQLYPNHLAIATCMRAWAEHMTPELVAKGRMPGSEPINEDDYMLGYVRALQDMADLLVDGDGLPDGPLHGGSRTA